MLSLSDYRSLFICGSCKFRLQCEEPHSYLCVKAPLAGLPWYSPVFKLVVNWQSHHPRCLRLVRNCPFKQFNTCENETRQDDWCVTNQKRMYFLRLNSQICAGTCLKIFLSEVKGCMGVVTSSNLWLFVPASHQSATVKASTAGALTSSTLRILPPPPPPSAWLFLFAPLCLYAQYTPYLFSSPVCTELEDAKLSLLECRCKWIHFKQKKSLVSVMYVQKKVIFCTPVWPYLVHIYMCIKVRRARAKL